MQIQRCNLLILKSHTNSINSGEKSKNSKNLNFTADPTTDLLLTVIRDPKLDAAGFVALAIIVGILRRMKHEKLRHIANELVDFIKTYNT